MAIKNFSAYLRNELKKLNQHDDYMVFYERWKRGKPSREQRIRRDFHYLWMEDNMHRFPHLQALNRAAISPSFKVIRRGKKMEIKLKYVSPLFVNIKSLENGAS